MIDWDKEAWGKEGQNVTHAEDGSWVEDAQKEEM